MEMNKAMTDRRDVDTMRRGDGEEAREEGVEWLTHDLVAVARGDVTWFGSVHTGRDHARCGCRSALRDRRDRLAALISEGNACAILTP